MRPLCCLALGLSLVLVGCTRSSQPKPAQARSAPPNGGVQITGTRIGDLVVGEPVTFQQLTIFPLVSLEPKNEDRFITLDEGLAAGTVKIVEVGAETGSASADETRAEEPTVEAANQTSALEVQAGDVYGDVNQLLVINSADKPLYLMPGEVISGGKQDRTIGQYVVIQPGPKPVPIDVFCVEQGRWSGRTMEGTSEFLEGAELAEGLSLVVSQTMAVEELANNAQRGEFVASVGQLSKNVRLAVQDTKDQGDVWREVGTTNSSVGNEAETGDFALAYSNPDVANNLKTYVDALDDVADTKQIVGVAVSVNGRMLSSDVFESTPLFRKFWPKLLKSYALDAYAAAGSGDTEEVQVSTLEQCVSFLQEIAESEAKTDREEEGQIVTRSESSKAVRFSYYDADAASAAGVSQEGGAAMASFGGGGFGGAVHSGSFGK